MCLQMGWDEQLPLANDTSDAASLSALALGKLPELLVRRRHSQQERLGCSVPRRILSFSPMISLLTDCA